MYTLEPYTDDTPLGRLTRRSPVQLASVFVPQDGNLSREAHFPLQTVFSPHPPPYPRFINRFDSREVLLVVRGATAWLARWVRRRWRRPPRLPRRSGGGGSERNSRFYANRNLWEELHRCII